MELALWADEQVGFEIFAKSNGAAAFALGPQTFGADATLFGRRRLINRLLFPLEPSHFAIFSCCGHRLHPSQPTQFRRSGSSAVFRRSPFSQFNSLYHAGRECPWCRGVLLLS